MPVLLDTLSAAGMKYCEIAYWCCDSADASSDIIVCQDDLNASVPACAEEWPPACCNNWYVSAELFFANFIYPLNPPVLVANW